MANQIALTFPDTAYSSSVLPDTGILSTDLDAIESAHNALDAEAFTKDGAKAMTGELDMGGNKITNLAEPTNDNDAARKVDVTPAGGVMEFAGATAPTGWFLCRGQEISRVTYADLFTAIGTTFGAGDGSTTFLIPAMEGKSVVGVSTTDTDFDLGDTGGAKTHSLATHTHTVPTHQHDQTDHYHTMPDHYHSYDRTFSTITQGSGTNSVTRNFTDFGGSSYFGSGPYKGDITEVHVHTTRVNGNTGTKTGYVTNSKALGNTGNNNGSTSTGNNTVPQQEVMNPFIALNYIIKT